MRALSYSDMVRNSLRCSRHTSLLESGKTQMEHVDASEIRTSLPPCRVKTEALSVLTMPPPEMVWIVSKWSLDLLTSPFLRSIRPHSPEGLWLSHVHFSFSPTRKIAQRDAMFFIDVASFRSEPRSHPSDKRGVVFPDSHKIFKKLQPAKWL